MLGLGSAPPDPEQISLLSSQKVYWSALATNAPVDHSNDCEMRDAVLSLVLSSRFVLELDRPTQQLISLLTKESVIAIISGAAFQEKYAEEGTVFTLEQEEAIAKKLPAVFRNMLNNEKIRSVYLSNTTFTDNLMALVQEVATKLTLRYSTCEALQHQIDIISSILSALVDTDSITVINMFSADHYSALIGLLVSDKVCSIVPLLHEQNAPPFTLIHSMLRYLSRLLQGPDPSYYHVGNICTALTSLFSRHCSDLAQFRDQIVDVATHMAGHIARYNVYKGFITDLINLTVTYFSLYLSTEVLTYTEEDLRSKERNSKALENSLESSIGMAPVSLQHMTDVVRIVIGELTSVYQCPMEGVVQRLSCNQVYYTLLLVARFFCCFGELKEAVLLGNVQYNYVPEFDSVHITVMEVYLASETSRAEMSSTAYLGCGGSSEWLSSNNADIVELYTPIFAFATSLCCKELLEFIAAVSCSSRFINANMILCPLTRIRNSMLELGLYDNALYNICFYESGLLDRYQYYMSLTKPKAVCKRPAEIAYLTCTAHKAIDYAIGTSDRSVFRSRREGFNLGDTFAFDDPLPCENIWELTNTAPSALSYLYALVTRGEVSSVLSGFLEMYDSYTVFSRRFPDSSMLFELSVSSTMEVSDIYTAASIVAPPLSVTPYEKPGTPTGTRKGRIGSGRPAGKMERQKSLANNEEFLQCVEHSIVDSSISRSNAPQRKASPPENDMHLISSLNRELRPSIGPEVSAISTVAPEQPYRQSMFSVDRADSSYHRASVFSAYSQITSATNPVYGITTEPERGISRSASRAIWAMSSWNDGNNTLPLEADINMDNEAVNLMSGC